MAFPFRGVHTEIGDGVVECVLEMGRVVDEKREVRDPVFFAEFTKEQHGEVCLQRLKQPDTEELIRVGIDRRKQPVTLAGDADQCLVDRDLIRLDVTVGL